MDCNINKNNQASGTRPINHNKSFQEKGIKRFKNRNASMNDNFDFRNVRNNKLKTNCKTQVDKESEMIKIADEMPYRCFNGERSIKPTAYTHDRKLLLNSNEYSKYFANTNVCNDTKRNACAVRDQYKSHDCKLERSQSEIKNTSSDKQRAKTTVKLKLNFLQESQLNTDIFEADSNTSKDTSVIVNTSKIQHNGLNPSAIEFTPGNTTRTTTTSSSDQGTETLSNGFKSLTLAPEHLSDYPFHSQQMALFQSDKLGLIDSSLLHSVYQCPQATLSRLSYPSPQQILPQFSGLGLYSSASSPLIRYNATNNFPTNYVLYNPVNGLYQYQNNLCAGTNNRIVTLATTDMSPQVPHIFNPYQSAYYTDSINSAYSHIR